MTWTPQDFAFTNDSPGDIDLSTNFGRLLYQTTLGIHGLNLFRAVLPYLTDRPEWENPTCVVEPMNDVAESHGNTIWQAKYRFSVGIVVVGEDGGLLVLQMLALRKAVRDLFRSWAVQKLPFGEEVPGHWQTVIEEGEIGSAAALRGHALAWDSGIRIVYTVQENS